MEKAIIKLETLACPSCMQKIENALKGLEGIDKESIKVMFNSSKAKLTFDPGIVTIKEIETAIEDLGYPVIKSTVKAA